VEHSDAQVQSQGASVRPHVLQHCQHNKCGNTCVCVWSTPLACTLPWCRTHVQAQGFTDNSWSTFPWLVTHSYCILYLWMTYWENARIMA
jgi:hypothetical protein